MKITRIVFPLVAGLMLSCTAGSGTQASTTSGSSSESSAQSEREKMEAAGFSSAEVVADGFAEAPCDYLIRVNGAQMLEPESLDVSYKHQGVKLWVKFTPQRRMSNCTAAQPATLDAVQIRKAP